jgi:hypothetical protein
MSNAEPELATIPGGGPKARFARLFAGEAGFEPSVPA